MKRPKLEFKVKSMTEFYESVFLFAKPDSKNCDFVLGQFNLDKDKALNSSGGREYVEKTLFTYYDCKKAEIEKCCKKITKLWVEIENQILNEFEKIFQIKFKGEEVYTVEIGLNRCCPRFLDEKTFDVCLSNNLSDVIQTIIHELIHFVWFEKWKKVFPDWKRQDFEAPSLIWLFSEIAVEPVVRYSNLKKFCGEKPAYNHFYTTQIGGKNVIKFFNELFEDSAGISVFMRKGIDYIMKNAGEFKKL